MNESNRKREKGRSFEDQARDKSVYLYLLNCLTDLDVSEKEGDKQLNEGKIAKQWGIKNNRVFIQRVLRSTFPNRYTKEDRAKVKTVPGLTLNRLIGILAALEDYWQKKRLENTDNQIPRIITRAEKLRALNKFAQLSFNEREKIDLSITLTENLHQQLFEVITHPITGISEKQITPFYKNIINIYRSLKRNKNHDYINNTWDEYIKTRNKFIKEKINDLIETNYSQKTSKSQNQKEKQQETIFNKVKREINRIEFQSGIQENKSNTENMLSKPIGNDLQLLPISFIDNLTSAVVENQILTDDFPIYIQHFEIEKTRPLPLNLDNGWNKGLLNPEILNPNEKEESKGLETQFAYKVRVYFRVEKKDCNSIFEEELTNIHDKRLEFFEEVTGVGSILSLIIAAINRLLLWDIPILKEYFPVAQEILSQDEPICESVQWPVFSSALVKLCKKNDLEKAFEKNKNYDQVAENQEIAYGEYCGFDLVETAAKAALYARLRAIKQTGIDSIEYRTQLCHKIEELNALRKAENYLYFYPFSLKAMEGYLNQTILPKYRTNDKFFEFKDNYIFKDKDKVKVKVKPWSLVAYDAHLTLTKAYLQEGLYKIGKKFLDIIEPHIENDILNEELEKSTYGELICVKYELCQFRYYYLTDLQDPELKQLDRTPAINQALIRLNKAQKYLQRNTQKYYLINQSSQSNFHPFFYLLSRVYSHKAKICMFFPGSYADLNKKNNNTLLEAIYLFEKARIYAARDGDATHYAYWTAYQSWCYLIVAFLGKHYNLEKNFSQEQCLSWSKRLIKHALICYSATGKLCYQQIKDNGGNITSCRINDVYYEQYGANKITAIPLIQELEGSEKDYSEKSDLNRNIVNLDTSILRIVKDSTYLFGTSSSIIIFSQGMLELCEEQKDKQKLKQRINKAIKMFTYCSLIADDGSEPNSKLSNENESYIDRIFYNNQEYEGDYSLRGLYPHRISQFADFGKIFVVVCKAILILSQDSEYSWKEIFSLLGRLHKLSSWNSENILNQERYNGHLSNHFLNVTNYFRQLEQNNDSFYSKDLIEIRNEIVSKTFTIMRGES